LAKDVPSLFSNTQFRHNYPFLSGSERNFVTCGKVMLFLKFYVKGMEDIPNYEES